MKILILNDADETSLGSSYKRAFEEIGHDVKIFDPEKLLERSTLWRNRLTRRLFEGHLIRKFNRTWLPELIKEDVDLIWVGKGSWAVPALWRDLRAAKPDLFTVCYNPDNPIVTYSRGGNRPWVTRSIGCFDLYCTYNAKILEALKDAGAWNIAHIPFGWDSKIHPQSEIPESEFDLVFIGGSDAYREKWLTDIVTAAHGRDWKIAVFGRWPVVTNAALKKIVHPHPVFGKDMAELINKSKVALNILRIQNEGSHNMRTFEIPGCGGLMASQRSPEQEAFFHEDDSAVYYETAEEAVENIGRLIDDPEKLRSMKVKAREEVRLHSYRARAEELLQNVTRAKARRGRYRLGILATHPIQYQAPLFQALASHPDIDLKVFYASLEGAEQTNDPGFGVSYKWDVPLLDGYDWKALENTAHNPIPGTFFGSNIPGIGEEIVPGRFDAFLIFGWARRCYHQACRACRKSGTPIMIRSEARIDPHAGAVKNGVKRALLSRFLKRFSAYLSIGHHNEEFYRWCGVPEEKTYFAPYCVDNDFFGEQSEKSRPNRNAIRKEWGFSPEQTVFLFSGKFVSKKRPVDIVAAAEHIIREGMATPEDFGILFVGSGPLEDTLRKRVDKSGLPVTFAGFLNQGEIARAYTAADCSILSSGSQETWGVVVNEAMAAGLPAIVSDQVGSAADLVKDGETGYVYPMGQVDSLSDRMAEAIRRPTSLKSMGAAAREHVGKYSFETSVTGVLNALEKIAE